MITRNTLGAIALATTCLVPLAAFAQTFPAADETPTAAQAAAAATAPYTGNIGIGVMGVFGTNADQAGRYNGLNTTGVDALGSFEFRGGDTWNSGGTFYYSLSGNNLVFQTGNRLGSGVGTDSGWSNTTNNSLLNAGSIEIDVGNQGTWESHSYYNAITYTGNVIDSLYSVHGSQEVLNNNLAPYGGATSSAAGSFTKTTATIPALTATGAMQPTQTGTRRDILGTNFKYILGDWTFTGAFRHEHKEGTMEETYDGVWGGTAFPMPIDYDTDRFDVTAAYTTRLYQAQVQYTFSHFTDNNTYVTLPYPVSNTAQPYQEAAAYALPPSNEAHYVTVMLATNAVPKTRINLNARVGVEKQDDNFAPNTADPNPSVASGYGSLQYLNGTLLGTTQSALDAIATIYQVRVSASSNPFPKVDTNVYYGIDGRDVSLNQYKVIGSGSGSDSSLSGTYYVVPQEWFKQNAGAEVGYRLLPESNTRVTVGYRMDAIDRSNAQVGHSWTNTATVGLSSNLGPQVNGSISFDYIDRSGTLSYITPWANLANNPNTGPTYSGAYYQAPMTAEAVTARADYTPTDKVSTDFFVRFRNEDYTYPTAYSENGTTAPLTGSGGGVKQDYTLTLGPDINYRPSKNVNLHLFYTYELLFYNNIGNGACSTSNTGTNVSTGCAGSVGDFQNKDTSSTHTVGISADWQVNDKLKLKGDYTFSYGTVMFAEYNGVFIPGGTASYMNVTNYPDIDSQMHNVKLTATYALRPNVDLVLQGVYVYYHDNNWYDSANAIQGAGSTATNLLTPGYGSPNYSIGMILTGIRFKL